jgi:hypothetical protein
MKMIPLVDVTELPPEAEEWLIEREYNTHYDNDCAHVQNDGNPLSEYIKAQGFVFEKDYTYVGIIGT